MVKADLQLRTPLPPEVRVKPASHRLLHSALAFSLLAALAGLMGLMGLIDLMLAAEPLALAQQVQQVQPAPAAPPQPAVAQQVQQVQPAQQAEQAEQAGHPEQAKPAEPGKQGTELPAALAQAGVFFRADAPRALRNPDDPNLPIVLEIINGVEKAAHTTGITFAGLISRPPLKLKGVDVYVCPATAHAEFADEPVRLAPGDKPGNFTWDARENGEPLAISDRFSSTLQVPRAAIESYVHQHYLGSRFPTLNLKVTFRLDGWPSQSFYLRVRLDAPPLPHLANWYRGDPHVHSAYTDNPAERGHALEVTRQAALATGLDWIVLSDHSTDLNPERFAAELEEVRKYRDARFLFIRGEEVTVASGKAVLLATLHLLALPSPDDPDRGFGPTPADAVIATGDGSITSAAMPLGNALDAIARAGGFAYAAHPFDPISPLLRGGVWDVDVDFLDPGPAKRDQLRQGLVGLEPWNRATTATADDPGDPYCIRRDADPAPCFHPDPAQNQYTRLEKGMATAWQPLLQRGLAANAEGVSGDAPAFKTFLAAGSDAHGDFNYESTLDAVDFLADPSRAWEGYAEDNALGTLATVVYCPQGMGPRGENVLRALRQGTSVLSNGPLLAAAFVPSADKSTSLDDPQAVPIGGTVSSALAPLPPLALVWVSSAEFGPLSSIRLVLGSRAGEHPEEIAIPEGKAMTSGGLVPIDLRGRLAHQVGQWGYVRLEARSRNRAGEESRCYTNPLWYQITGP